MTEEKNTATNQAEETPVATPATPASAEAKVADKPADKAEAPKTSPRGGGRFAQRGAGGGQRGRGGFKGKRRLPKTDVPAESDYEEKNIEVSRVTRVTKGGKRMRFRVLAVIGNHKGRAGYGLAKGLDVASAMAKATSKARKSLINIPIVKDSIPHPITIKYRAARIVMKPAPKGTGVKAGGAVRTVLELAGIPNVTAKILGTNNKVNNVKAVFEALQKLVPPEEAENKVDDVKKENQES
ncbi:30S ribosomal protein S5 [Patescibacteria group bacterium]|nr:30S ribosomal protein S5 [Patescibacteria group bacterium]